ncbi:MAG: PAS domain-containing protein [Salinivirgaceae bacterium]|nr:PAS domain-containing protein [Salinivirgaceae bacterium]
MKYSYFFIVLLLSLCFFSVGAKENGKPFIKNYTSKLYKGHTQNWVIEQDSNGIMYFGNQVGVITFDGSSWRTIQISNHSTVRSLAKSPEGRIYVGAVGEFGYLEPNAHGKVEFISLKPKLDSIYQNFGEVWSCAQYNGDIFFLTDKWLFQYDGKSFKTYKSKGENFYLCFPTPNAFFVHDFGYGLTILSGDSLKLVPNGEEVKIESINSILAIDDENIIIATRENGLYKVNYKKGSYSLINKNLQAFAEKNEIYQAIQISRNKYALATIHNGVAIVDGEGKLIEVINKKAGLLDETVYYLYESNGVLWCALEKGIAKIEITDMFRFWDESVGLLGSLTDVSRFDKKLFVATGNGLYYLENDGSVELDVFKKCNNIETQTWDLQEFSNKLLIGTGRGLWIYENDSISRVFRGQSVLKILVSKKIPNRIYLGMRYYFAYIDYIPDINSFTEPKKVARFNVEVRQLIEDHNGRIWAGLIYTGVAKFDIIKSKDSSYYTNKIYTQSDGLAIERDIRLLNLNNEIYFSSDKGLFQFDPIKDKFIPDTKFYNQFTIKPNNPIKYNFDSINKHWINGKYIVTESNGVFSLDSLLLKRLPPFIVEQQYIEKNGTIWIGTSDGLFHFNQYSNYPKTSNFKVIIRKVATKKDSVIYWGTKKTKKLVKIDHHTNFIAFFYSAPYFVKEQDLKYSYYLDGYDNKWSDWTKETKKEFTNLFEGRYTFKVKAKNYLGQISEIDEYSFSILPPLYRTLLAYLIYAILFMALITAIVYFRTKKLRLDKIKLERIINSRTQEIILQKDEIEVTAKKLKLANQELKKLSIIAEKSDNAVVIFDKEGNIQWINKGFTRMYGYTLEQFVFERGRNLIEASENPNIASSIKECIETKETTIYQYFAINRNGNGIWAQTTLTPLLDKEGNLQQLIAIDTDITKIKDAELKIETQRDELKITNENKDKLFTIIAHDLRGPLSNIFTLLNIIYNELDMLEPDQLKNLIGQLKETTGNTFNLTENLLDWAHLRRNSISYRPRLINLKELIHENIELFDSQANKKSIRLINKLKGTENVFADEEMVKTILRNLLANAIKFTGQNGKIILSTSLEGKFRWIHINDTGKGMDPKEIDKLFRIDKPHTTLGTNKEKGSGLGLILTKEFIEKNHGEIRVESVKNEGSVFSFSLPIEESQFSDHH